MRRLPVLPSACLASGTYPPITELGVMTEQTVDNVARRVLTHGTFSRLKAIVVYDVGNCGTVWMTALVSPTEPELRA